MSPATTATTTARPPSTTGPDPVGNDLTRFFLAVERADIPDQRGIWGLADVELEEVSVGSAARARFTDALVAATRAAPPGRSPWNPFETAFALTYDSAHVLPHIVDSIVVSGRHLTIGYLGANTVLRTLIDDVVRELSPDGSLEALYASDEHEVDELAESADLVIVDFGLDATLESPAELDQGERHEDVPLFPKPLRPVVIAFERLLERERARLDRGLHPRRFLLVNSSTVYLDSFVVSNLDCSSRATHSRVRRATVKRVPTAGVDLVRDVRWADRLTGPREPLALRIGRTSSVARLEDFSGFGSGWWLPDPSGIWSHGPRAVLTLAVGRVPAWTRPVLELTFDRVGVRRGRPVRIGLVVEGTRVETRELTGGTHPTRWRVRLPRHALARRAFDLALEFDGDVDWADKNRLGLHIQSLRVRTALLPIPLQDGLDRAAGARGGLARGWRRALRAW